jgi:hypothetical protein
MRSREEVCSVIRFLWGKHISPNEIFHILIEVYGDGVVSVQHVRKCCREFKNGETNIHDADCSSQISTSRVVVNAA